MRREQAPALPITWISFATSFASLREGWCKRQSHGRREPAMKDIIERCPSHQGGAINIYYRAFLTRWLPQSPSVTAPVGCAANYSGVGGNETSLNPFMGSKYPMHGWQANLRRACAQPVVLGLRPKLKYPPAVRGDIYCYKSTFIFVLRAISNPHHSQTPY